MGSIVAGLFTAYGAQAMVLLIDESKYQFNDWQLVWDFLHPPSVQQQPWLVRPVQIRQSHLKTFNISFFWIKK